MNDSEARDVLKRHAAAYGDRQYEPARWVIDAVQSAVAVERARVETTATETQAQQAFQSMAEFLGNVGITIVPGDRE